MDLHDVGILQEVWEVVLWVAREGRGRHRIVICLLFDEVAGGRRGKRVLIIHAL